MSVKTILVAHQSPAVRDRFAAALADARQEYLLAGTEPALRVGALAGDRLSIEPGAPRPGARRRRRSGGASSTIRGDGPRRFPVVVFAGSVTSAEQVELLAAAGVAGYVNEHADAPHILPALAPHLFPDNFNRRAGSACPSSLPISFRAGQTIAAAQTRDIGRGGVGIQTMEPLPAGTPFNSRLKLPGNRATCRRTGRVVWSDRRIGMGVQFDKPDAGSAGAARRSYWRTSVRSKQPEAVGRHEQGRAGVGDDRHPHRGQAGRRQHDKREFQRERDRDVLPDVGESRAAEAERERQLRQIVGHQHHVGGFERDVACRRRPWRCRRRRRQVPGRH